MANQGESLQSSRSDRSEGLQRRRAGGKRLSAGTKRTKRDKNPARKMRIKGRCIERVVVMGVMCWQMRE